MKVIDKCREKSKITKRLKKNVKKDVKSITFVKTYTVSLSLSGNGGHIKVKAIKQIR
jgi:hypothetical protein